MDKQNVIYSYSGKLFNLKKGKKLRWGSEESSSKTCYNIDESCSHYTKRKKPDTKGKILCNSACMEYSELDKFIET